MAALRAGLHEHSLPATGAAGFVPLAAILRDPRGRLAGGVYGQVNWNWLHVNLLWVARERRGQGLGTCLLRAIEEAGAGRGCRNVHLDTFSFQAPGFYEKQGYEVFGVPEDYPPGQRRRYLRKPLQPARDR